MKKIIAVIGARPQFIKHAPLELASREFADRLSLQSIHTGQHYDENMSEVFFRQLGMPQPEFMLHIGSASHGRQTGRMMEQIEEIILAEKPDGILVYGDTNSTLAGALVAAKLHVPVFHVEAGLRSFNREMPEEINRVLTDHLSALLFAPTDQAVGNLQREGITDGVVRTGDIMYDMLLIAQKNGIVETLPDRDQYYLATIHRPYNTDDPDRLRAILIRFNTLDLPVKFPMHPRTANLAGKYGIELSAFPRVKVVPAVSYFQNLNYMANARAIITDSGGMQKESYFLQKQCVTIRKETEWVETLEGGWNTLVFDDLSTIGKVLEKGPAQYREGIYGDGDARYEILNHILDFFAGKT